MASTDNCIACLEPVRHRQEGIQCDGWGHTNYHQKPSKADISRQKPSKADKSRQKTDKTVKKSGSY